MATDKLGHNHLPCMGVHKRSSYHKAIVVVIRRACRIKKIHNEYIRFPYLGFQTSTFFNALFWSGAISGIKVMGALLASWWGPHVKLLKLKLMEMVMQWWSSYKHSCTLQPVFALNLESLITLLLLFCNSSASLSTYLTRKINSACKQMNRKNILL